MLPFGSIRKLTLGSNSISEHYIEYQYSENNQDYSKYLETKFLKFSALLTMHQVQQILNGVNWNLFCGRKSNGEVILICRTWISI